jgi:hypothetical protein
MMLHAAPQRRTRFNMWRLLILFICALAQLAAYEAPLAPSSLEAPLEVYLHVGQSNTVGNSGGDATNLTSDRNDTLLPVWVRAGSDPVSLPAGVVTLDSAVSNTRANEYGFLRTMHSRGHYRAISLKHATNGKALYNWWLPGNTGYAELLESIAEFEADVAPQTVRYKALIWVQGDGDGQYSSWANAYQTNLTTLVAQLRADLATPDLVVIAPEHPPAWNAQPYASTVKAGVTAFCAADSRAMSFAVEDTTDGDNDDDTHYEGASHEIIGVRAANAYLDNF